MGQILSYKHGENSVANVDPRLWDIVQNAIAAVPYDAQIRSGAERGPGDKGNHSKGYAVDVTLFDPRTGQKIPDTGKYGGVPAAKIYEQYAQAARVYQKEHYPELDKTFRWGGGFRQGGTPFDLMHLDITPRARGAMAYYSWENGFNANAEAALPGIRAATSGGLGGANGARLISQYRQAFKGSGGLVPPAVLGDEAPVPATLTRGVDNARITFAANLANTPIPRPRPSLPTVDVTTLTDPRRLAQALGVLDSAVTMGVSPRLPAARDFTGTFVPSAAEEQQSRAKTPTMDQTAEQARSTVLDPGIGSLLGSKTLNPAAPNQIKPSVAGLVRVPQGVTVDPVGPGATLAELSAFTGQPVSGRWNTGQGIAARVGMPADARPTSLPPPKAGTSLALPTVASGSALAAPGAGLTAAQRAAISGSGAPIPATMPAGLRANALEPPVPASMPQGLRGNALPTSQITVTRPKAAGSTATQSTAPRLYQSGDYIYVASPSGGYTKVGRVQSASSPNLRAAAYSGGGTTTDRSASSASASRSTAGLRPGDRTYNADTNTWEVK